MSDDAPSNTRANADTESETFWPPYLTVTTGEPPKPDAPVIKGPRPPRPAVTTQIEPGIVNVEKLNKEVKNSKKRRQFADFDRKKYGIADNLLRELGHKHGDRNGRGGTPSRGGRR